MRNNLCKKLVALGMAGVTLLSTSYSPDVISAASVSTSYYKKATSIKFTEKKGIKKITVNGKKIKVKKKTKKVSVKLNKEGKYTIVCTNKKGKSTKKIVYIDKTAPVISGVENGKIYNASVTVTVSDNFKLKNASINGQPFKGSFNVTTAGTYNVIATDKAGNKRKITFWIEKQNTATGSAISGSAGQVTATAETTKTGANTSSTQPSQTAATNNTIPTDKNTNQPTNNPNQVPNNTNNPASVPTQPTDNAGQPVETANAEQVSCEHEWTETFRKEPTCEIDGSVKKECTKCNVVKWEVISKTGHSFEDKMISPATCTQGAIYQKVCSKCGQKSGEPWQDTKLEEHNFCSITGGSIVSPATCTQGAIYHQVCSKCEAESEDTWQDTKLAPHTFCSITGGSIVSPATCTQGAIYHQVCSKCGAESEDTWQDTTLASHSYEKGITQTVKEADKINDRTYHRVCDHCNAVDDEILTESDTHTDKVPPRMWLGVYYKEDANYQLDVSEYPITGKYVGFLNEDFNSLDETSSDKHFWAWEGMETEGAAVLIPPSQYKECQEGNYNYATMHIGISDGENGSGVKNVQILRQSYMENVANSISGDSEKQKLEQYYQNYKKTGFMDSSAYNASIEWYGVKVPFTKTPGFAQYAYILVEDWAGNVRLYRTQRVF